MPRRIREALVEAGHVFLDNDRTNRVSEKLPDHPMGCTVPIMTLDDAHGHIHVVCDALDKEPSDHELAFWGDPRKALQADVLAQRL